MKPNQPRLQLAKQIAGMLITRAWEFHDDGIDKPKLFHDAAQYVISNSVEDTAYLLAERFSEGELRELEGIILR